MSPNHTPLTIDRQDAIAAEVAGTLRNMTAAQQRKYNQGEFFLEIAAKITNRRTPYRSYDQARAQLLLKHGNMGIGAVGVIYFVALLKQAKPGTPVKLLSRNGDVAQVNVDGTERNFEVKFATRTTNNKPAYQMNFSASQLKLETASDLVIGFMFDLGTKSSTRALLTPGHNVVELYEQSRQEGKYNLSITYTLEKGIGAYLRNDVYADSVSLIRALRAML